MYDVTRQFDRSAPSFCADILSKFGVDDYGDPIYRIVWSESQFETVGGMWEERANPVAANKLVRHGRMLIDSNPVICKRAAYKQVTKYPEYQGANARWILEKKLPCSFSPELWDWKFYDSESGLYLSGPYPEHGEYWCSKILTDRGAYMEPTADVVEYYARLIAAGDEYSDVQKRIAIEDRERRKQRAKDNQFDAVWDDSMPVGGVLGVFSGPGRKTNRKTVDDVKFAKVPHFLPTTPGNKQM